MLWVALFMFFVAPGPFSQQPSVCCGTGHIKDLAFDRIVFEYPSDCQSWIKGNATAGGRVDHINFNDILIMGEPVEHRKLTLRGTLLERSAPE